MNFDPISKDEWEQTGTFLSEGEAEFVVTDVTEGVTGSGDPKIVVEFEASQGESRGKAFDHISSKARFKIVGLCKAIGDKELMLTANNGALERDLLLGKKGRFELKNHEYNGKTYLQIAKYINKGKEEVEQTIVDDDLPF